MTENGGPVQSTANPISSATTVNPPTNPLSPNTTVNATGSTPDTGGMSFADVVNAWIQAGGNPQAAQMAAAIADAESGLNPNASYTNPDGTVDVGLWMLPKNGIPPGSTDPTANARAAIQLSNNGTNWQQWCSSWSDNDCGCQGGTYLGEGSNALASLAGQLGSFNVIGSSPTGSGTSASTAPTTPPTSTSSTSHTILIWAIVIALVIAVFMFVKHKGAAPEGESESKSQSPWTPDEEAAIQSSDLSDKQLSQQMGRSVRSIRVRRNQAK